MNDEKEVVLPDPVDWDEMYPGRFMKGIDLKGKKVTVVIKHVKMSKLLGEKGLQTKGLLSFEGKEKQLPLNKTNGLCLKAMFGKKVQGWVGHKVTLYSTDDMGFEDVVRIWGSPDLPGDLPVTIALPRKRPKDVVMHKVVPETAP